LSKPVYSVVFINVQGTSGVAVNYVVPETATAIVRDVDIYFNTANPELLIQMGDANSHGTWFAHQVTVEEVGGPTWVGWRGRQVFEAGQTFYGYCQDALGVGADIRVSGYLLTNP
jgi:hypothetical protein